MKAKKFSGFWIMFIILGLAALACGTGTTPIQPIQVPTGPTPTLITAQQPSSNATPSNNTDNNTGGDGLNQAERTRLISATVQIVALIRDAGQLKPAWSGSGTILSPSGLILTNAHVAQPTAIGESRDPDALMISLVESEDKPPVPSYIAEVRAVDGYIDLAVVQIVSTVNGDAIDPNSLNLPFVEIGAAENVHVGDDLFVFGFPGIGGETLTFTRGIVSGFASDKRMGDRAWIKTDATIAGGNSGGLAADSSGRIIGIPTSIGAVGTGLDCRPVQDTNQDGQVDNQDICVPVSNFISDVRPVNWAIPLIQAAQTGKQYVSPIDGGSNVTSGGSGAETLSNFMWLSSNADCDPGDPVQSYQSNVTCIVPGFDYSGMTDGEQFREVWTHNGKSVGDFTYTWEWGTQGSFASYLNNNGDPLPDGTYHVEFFAGANLEKVGEAPDIVVGTQTNGTNPPLTTGQGVILYGKVTDADTGNPVSGAKIVVLKPGIKMDAWSADNYPESDILFSTETDNQGKYTMNERIQRGVGYTVAAFADGYNIVYGEDMVWTDQDPDNYELNIDLTK